MLQCVAVCFNVSERAKLLCAAEKLLHTCVCVGVIVLHCVAGLCGVSWRAAVCCSVLQRVAACCSVLQSAVVCCSVLQCAAVCCSVLQGVTVYCRVLPCIVVCCSVLQGERGCYSWLKGTEETCKRDLQKSPTKKTLSFVGLFCRSLLQVSSVPRCYSWLKGCCLLLCVCGRFCVAVCCSVLQCVTVCNSVLQCAITTVWELSVA